MTADSESAASSAGPPTFSIVVPTYNQASFLPAALDSILAQGRGDWEAVIVDDGSTDSTPEVAARYAARDSRFRVVRKANGGVASALNLGIENARGQWMCWLSSDDLLEPGALRDFARGIAANPSCRFFHSNYFLLSEKTGQKGHLPASHRVPIPEPAHQVLAFFASNYVSGISICIGLPALRQVGPFDPRLRHAQDADMWMRLSARFPSVYLPETTCTSRIHDTMGTRGFPEAGLFDTGVSCLRFLNEHPFPALFPLLDLAKPDEAVKAMTAAMLVAANPRAHMYWGVGHLPALLDRMQEWFTRRFPARLRAPVAEALAPLARELSPEGCPEPIARALARVARPGAKPFTYRPTEPLEAMVAHLRALEAAGPGAELAPLRRYLVMVGALPAPAPTATPTPTATATSTATPTATPTPPATPTPTAAPGAHARPAPEGLSLVPRPPWRAERQAVTAPPPALRECSIVPGEGGMAELALVAGEGDGAWLTSTRLSLVAPLGTLTLTHPATGRTVHAGKDELLALLSRGYDLGRELARAAPAGRTGERPAVAFTFLTASTLGGATITLFRLVNWLADAGVDVAIYSREEPPGWTTLNARFRCIVDPEERYAAIAEPIVVVGSILELPHLLRHGRGTGQRIFHLCQGAEEYHYVDPGGRDLLDPIPLFDVLNAIPAGRIAVSPHLERYFAAKYRQRTLRITNGIPPGLFEPTVRAPRTGGEFTLLVSGNPHQPLKNVPVVREALRRLARARPGWRLTLLNACGERVEAPPPGEGFTHELCCEVRPAEMPELYRRADVVLNASRYEGFGLPSLEAMASGVPVVQADNHGLEGIAEDGRNCLLVPPGDAAALASAVERLLADPALAARLAEGGRRTAAEFPLDRQHEELLRAYGEISGTSLAAGPRRAAGASASPLFSVMIPCYNQAHFLVDALESLLAQSYGNWEAVAVDDGSTDDTPAVLRRYAARDPRIRTFRQENGGVASALNRALAEARGDWICWLSSDDLFLPDKLALHRDLALEDPGLRLVHTGYHVLHQADDSLRPSGIDAASFIPPAEQQVIRFFQINYVNGISVAVHRAVFDRVGGFDEGYRYGQDYDLWLRASALFRSRYLARTTCVTRLHGQQGTASFPQAGIYDSARAALAFLEGHGFEALFPMVDLSQPGPAVVAAALALRIALDRGSFVARCGFEEALVDRLCEWAAGLPAPCRAAIARLLALAGGAPGGPSDSAELRRAAAEFVPLLQRGPPAPEVAARLQALREGAPRPLPYPGHDALALLERRAARTADAGERAALQRYLLMVREAPGTGAKQRRAAQEARV